MNIRMQLLRASFLTALILFAWCNISAQGRIKNKKPYIFTVQMLSGEKKNGVAQTIDSTGVQLLPYQKGGYEFMRRQATAEQIIPFHISSEQIKLLSIHRKGTTRKAMAIGIIVGLTAGTLIGGMATPKRQPCPPNAGLCSAFDGLERLSYSAQGFAIGIGVGALSGLIIGEGKKKRFTINGDRRKYYDVQRTLSDKVWD